MKENVPADKMFITTREFSMLRFDLNDSCKNGSFTSNMRQNKKEEADNINGYASKFLQFSVQT